MTDRSIIFVSSNQSAVTKAEQTRQFIIEQAAPIFNIKGVAATAMSDIMEATKLAKGSLYVHFENKDELAYAVVDYNLNKLVQKAREAAAKQKTAREKLFAYLHYFSTPTQPPVEGGCPMLNFGMEADDTNPVIREKVHKFIEASVKEFTVVLENGITNGEFKKELPVKEFAAKIFALIEGGTMMSRVAGNNNYMKIIIRSLKKEIEDWAS
jgi:AcrR family transcriptional regulator